MKTDTYKNNYQKYVNFIEKYKTAINASSGSEVDANANVEQKNVTTLSGELYKKEIIGTNRLLMINKITEMFGEDLAKEYIRQLDSHEIYKHDETSLLPYCVSITMYPFLFDGMEGLGGMSSAPKNLGSFLGSFINLVFAVAAQFAGAVSTPEFLTYLDYFLRLEYGDDYYLNEYSSASANRRNSTIKDVIEASFQQVVYSLNSPAAARNLQSVFWNLAYFDKPYFHGIFDGFFFPDGTQPKWDSVNWLQKRFMKWFNKERLKKVLTFPVETVNLLDDGTDYVDKEWKDFTAEMYAEGHSFFTYRSDSVDSLASCCFRGDQVTLTKSSDGVNFMSFKDLYDAPYNETKRNFTIFHNGSWVRGRIVRLPKKPMYKVVTTNKKTVYVTEDHIHLTMDGEKNTKELCENDWLLFNNLQLDTFPEQDKGLTYSQGILVGMYLGDGSMDKYATILSLNEEKYNSSISHLMSVCGSENVKLGKEYNHVYPVTIRSKDVQAFIREYVTGDYCYEKQLNMNCLLQSCDFRRGILDGYYLTDGGNSNRIYTTSAKMVPQIECLITSLGLNSVIDVNDRTDEAVVIRGESYTRNYPLYCIRWYSPKNKRSSGDVFRVKNNSIYFKVDSVEEAINNDNYVYCFEMSRSDEPYFTLPNGLITHNCRVRNEIQDNTFSFTLGAGGVSTGSKGVITINVNRLVQNAMKEGIDLSDAVKTQTLKVHKYLLAFNEIMLDNFNAHLLPVYDAGFISMKKQYLTLGINGFVEGAEFLGIEISPNEKYFEYGETILKPIFDANRAAKTEEVMFNTEFVPAENLGVKNAKWDREDGYIVPRDCYNSYFYRVETGDTNVIDKFILHGSRLTKYLDGGSALHCNLSEHLTKEQYLKMLDVMIKTGCSYSTFNIPNTACNECGFITKHRVSSCPRCGSKNLDYLTRIIGYLKRVSAFSEARQKEESKRLYDNGRSQIQ